MEVRKYVLIIVIIFFVFYSFPIPFSNEYEAIEIKLDDMNYLVSRKVKIQGKYYCNLLTVDRFKGNIIISGYDMTTNQLKDIYFEKDGYLLEYCVEENKEEFLGRIYAKEWFDKMAIIIFEENILSDKESKENRRGWNSSDGYCIVSGVDNYDTAVKVLKDSHNL